MNSRKDIQTFPRAEIDSDHNLHVAEIFNRLRKIIRPQKIKPNGNWKSSTFKDRKCKILSKRNLVQLNVKVGKGTLAGSI
jgi:hypothetical protein